MNTPHPSYPPIDIAAAGGIAVTNTSGNKVSLQSYSDSIICVGPDVRDLVGGIDEAVKRVARADGQDAVRKPDRISRDWEKSLDHVLQWLQQKR